jgi:DNA helicase HerA-like ATPase
MRKLVIALALVVAWVGTSTAQEKVPLRLVQTVSLAGVQRHWDHFGVDLKSNRLFVTSGDEPVVDVFDMRTNTKIHTIT